MAVIPTRSRSSVSAATTLERPGRSPKPCESFTQRIDAGINFLDNAWEYHEGESERRMGRAIADRRDAVFLMTKVCTHGRDASVAMRQLEQSLRRLRTDYLDLWQIHECVYYNDPERHFAKGGVIEALTRAKEQGKVRYVGFTGHKDPSIHLRMLSFGYPFDACQLPLNGFDARFRSFQALVLPELARQQIAAIGMKSLGGDGRAIRKRAARVEDALRYAMSLSGVHDRLVASSRCASFVSTCKSRDGSRR